MKTVKVIKNEGLAGRPDDGIVEANLNVGDVIEVSVITSNAAVYVPPNGARPVVIYLWNLELINTEN